MAAFCQSFEYQCLLPSTSGETMSAAQTFVPNHDELLQRLADESACRAVLVRYGIALDWQDRDSLTTVFWPDADIDYGFFKGTGTQLIDTLLHIATLSQRRFHMLGGDRIRLKGTIAEAESYIITQAISEDASKGQTTSLFYGRFLDRLERRQSEWRIASRVYLQHGAFAGPYEENKLLGGMLNADGLNTGHPLFRRE
jgi:hypothetical protein